MKIRKGDQLRLRAEWCDTPSEHDILHTALEDEDGGRVLIVAHLDLPINPTQVVATYMVEPYNEWIVALALAFGDRLRQEIGQSRLEMAAFDNDVELDPGVCHSHDHCDANMLMLAAFEEVFERTPDLSGESLQARHDYAAWAEAWDYAKRHRLFCDHWVI